MRRLLVILFFTGICFASFAQDEVGKKFSLNGYAKFLNLVTFNELESPWIIENNIHNRLNFSWYHNDNLAFTAQMRNRIVYGDYVKAIPGYVDMIADDSGYLNFLTNNLYSNSSAVINTSFDRLFFEYNVGSVTATVGRQRINWGQSFVWNPNDIFNAYSFFDFDYEERPGSDAIRLQYYPTFTSTAEAVVKVDKDKQITAAAMYRFNALGYDIQVLSGVLDSTDYVLGGGWTGSIQSVGFTGEVSYFHPQQNFSDTLGVVLSTVGFSYIFPNSLAVSVEGIYNGYFNKLNLAGFTDLFFVPMSVKTISYSKFTWFAQASYPIHPLLNAALAAMYFPSLGDGYFIMPTITYSVSQNSEFSLLGQRFVGQFNDQKESLNMLFLRFRLSF
ncbi:MAG: hypothetical protein RBT19_13900 [Tenuifilaceae bacterium]|jgi:hypothetical protein|nr:hypothetical protein [Tenuifilaceae bacterium]